MAVRSSYRIPLGINRSVLDQEIPLRKGAGALSAVPMRQFFFVIGSVFVVAWAVLCTFIRHAGPGLIILFIAWAAAAIAYFGRMTPTRELMVTQIPTMLDYIPRSSRHVYTRTGSPVAPFGSIVGIDRIDADGLIRFSDGGAGRAYLVVGSASYLLFDSDRDAILNRVDLFWRKVRTSCEWIWVTKQESQRVYHQIASLERRNRALTVRDPDLVSLMQEQYWALSEHVGKNFSSIHQYLILRADSGEALAQAVTDLRAETEQSQLMLRDVTALDRDEVLELLRSLYVGTDTEPVLSLSGLDTDDEDAAAA